MKRVVCLLALVTVSVTSTFGADPKPLTRPGDKALLFDLGGLANLAAGNYGGGLGFRYYIANSLALRLSLGFNTSTETTTNPVSPLPANQLGESDLSHTCSQSLRPSRTPWQNIPRCGLRRGMVSSRPPMTSGRGTAADSVSATTAVRRTASRATEWGVAGILGVEWWPWENISFSGNTVWDTRTAPQRSSPRPRQVLSPGTARARTDSDWAPPTAGAHALCLFLIRHP